MKFNYQYILGAVIAYIVLISFQEDGAIHFQKNESVQFFPQGYAFFTRNPREPHINIYEVFKDDSLVQINEKASLSAQNLFGLSRKNRRLNIEFQEVISKILLWENSFEKAKQKSLTLKLDSKESNKICGKYLFVKEERIPWAWIKNKKLSPKKKFKMLSINDCK